MIGSANQKDTSGSREKCKAEVQTPVSLPILHLARYFFISRPQQYELMPRLARNNYCCWPAAVRKYAV